MKVVILTMPIMTLAMNLTVMAVVWFGGQQILIGNMPVGNLTAFTTYVTQILMSLMMVSMIMIQGSRAMASSHRILEVLDTDIDLNDDNASEKDRLVTSGEIEFKNVCFRYYKNIRKMFCRILILQRNRAKWLVSSARQVRKKFSLCS